MKVVAFNGSPKKEGNTYHAIRLVAEQLEKEGIEVEIVHVGNKTLNGCLACGYCSENNDGTCAITIDNVNVWIEKMAEAEGILLGSPVYFAAVAGTMKSFLDRAFLVAGQKGFLRHKVGAAVVAVRRSGGIPTFNQLNNYLNFCEMILPTSNYWNVIHGMLPGEVTLDEEGVQIMETLGVNMAYVMKSLNNSVVDKPGKIDKVFTNFIR